MPRVKPGSGARMGAAMMAPDYAWWHGFYELKHRFATITAAAEQLIGHGPSKRYSPLAGSDAAAASGPQAPPRGDTSPAQPGKQ